MAAKKKSAKSSKGRASVAPKKKAGRRLNESELKKIAGGADRVRKIRE